MSDYGLDFAERMRERQEPTDPFISEEDYVDGYYNALRRVYPPHSDDRD